MKITLPYFFILLVLLEITIPYLDLYAVMAFIILTFIFLQHLPQQVLCLHLDIEATEQPDLLGTGFLQFIVGSAKSR
jgi:hypothetical protein